MVSAAINCPLPTHFYHCGIGGDGCDFSSINTQLSTHFVDILFPGCPLLDNSETNRLADVYSRDRVTPRIDAKGII